MKARGAADLALLLAVDCSSSIDAGDYQLQMRGIANALRQDSIYSAIRASRYKRLAFALVQWSTSSKQVVSLPWRLLRTRADFETAAHDVEVTPRDSAPGGTGMAAALNFAVAALQQMPFPATRYVIDISGDGVENDGGDVPMARAAALELGIVINGLPVITGSEELLAYYSDVVIGGPGAFVEPALNVMAFEEAMKRKLLRELQPLSV
jgi:hypothetical protein